MTGVKTHCPYCALQCGMTVLPGPPPRVVPRSFPTNGAQLCPKGFTAADLLPVEAGRLTTPLVREGRGDPLRPASWPEALDRVASGLARVRAGHGADAVGVLGGGGLTNEKAYLLGKFARVALGTRTIDYNGRFCMSSAAVAAQRAFGLDRGLPFPVTDLAQAGCVLLVGANPVETMPPLLGHLEQARAAGGTLVVVDPRRSATAALADLHLQLRPGTDLALALGLLHLALALGRVDEEYVATRTRGFSEVRRRVSEWWPERVERVTGVPVPQLRRAVELFTDAATAVLLTARGTEQHANGTDTTSAWINLALATGRVGRPGSGFGTLTGQGNGQGGREHGQKADQLPGYRRLDDPAARRHVAAVWGVEPDSLPGPGPDAMALLGALGHQVRALLVAGTNPVVSAPGAAEVQRSLGQLELLVVLDVVLSETAAQADVVLPVTQWAEEDGTMTNLEGRLLLRRRAVDPPEGVRTDLAVLSELAHRLGAPGAWPSTAPEVLAELARASAGGPADYAGISWERLAAGEALHWPCPGPGHPGTPRLFLDHFAHPDGRARFLDVVAGPPPEETDSDYPLLLVTGRVLAQYQSGAQTRRVERLHRLAPDPAVELHPDVAAARGVADGAQVRVSSRRGSALGRAVVTDSVRRDTVFMPFHYPGAGRVNLVTNPVVDPASRMPQLKVCAVRVDPAPQEVAP